MNRKRVTIIARGEGVSKVTTKSLLNLAEEYLKGYELITKDCPDSDKGAPSLRLWKVRYTLLSHSLELGFKAYLHRKGLTLEDLKNKLGHDLEKCLNESEQKGFCIFNTEEKETFERLNLYYSKKEFEYEKINYKSLPHPKDSEEITRKLLIKVKSLV